MTTYEYYPGGQLKSVTDALGHRTSYVIDGMKRSIPMGLVAAAGQKPEESSDREVALPYTQEAGNGRRREDEGEDHHDEQQRAIGELLAGVSERFFEAPLELLEGEQDVDRCGGRRGHRRHDLLGRGDRRWRCRPSGRAVPGRHGLAPSRPRRCG